MEHSDEHYTPKIVFDNLGLIFDLDVCAPKGGVNWIPAVHSYSIEDDGLASPWFGNVWMNPPFSKPNDWVEKFISHREGIALCVVSKSKWFHKLWNEAEAITPFPRTWKFERPDGSNKSISFQSLLFAFGAQNVKALQKLSDYRVR